MIIVSKKKGFDWSFLQKTKTIAWSDFFEVEEPDYITLQIKPDSSVRNHRSEDITRAIADLFRLPIDHISRDGAKIKYKIQEKVSFEIRFEGNKVKFLLSAPKNIEPIIKRRVLSVWPNATVEAVQKDESPFLTDNSAMYELMYAKHDLYSLHTNASDNMPLGSLLESSRLLGEKDKASVFAYFEPIHQATWQNDIKENWRKLRNGHSPKKWDSSLRNIALIGAIGVSGLLKEVVTAVSSILGGDEKENVYANNTIDPNATEMSIANLTNSTKEKQNKPAIKTMLWVVAECENEEQSDIVARTMGGSFGDLAGDNELKVRPLKGKKKTEGLRVMHDKKGPKINIGANFMSVAEASKIVQVPGRELQEKYPGVEAVGQREVEVDKTLCQIGTKLGYVTFRGKETTVYQPIDDLEQFCLPSVIIGGMGSGKTKGYGANKAVETTKLGFGSIVIDPAKGEMGDEIQTALKEGEYIRIRLGTTPISLDWREVKHSKKPRNRMANSVISFFDNATDEAGAQTSRFIRAAVMGMEGWKLSEVLQMFEDEEYRKRAIERLPEGIHKATLIEFDGLSDGMKTKIKSPIYNRMSVILGDEYLMACMEAEEGLDFVELTSMPKCVIIDVPKGEVDPEGVDLIVNLINSKLNLAMSIRPTYMEENELGEPFPVSIILDEPHQYMKSTQLWKAFAVESRKWRYQFNWMFHDWKQIDSDLRSIIKSALPHYHIYPSSKGTFEGLKEEIAPFTIEDGLNLKRFHAINVLRAGENGLCKPFIARMAEPPSKRKQNKGDK